MPSAIEQLTKAIQGRYSVVFVRTWEEERAVRLLESFAQRLYTGAGAIGTIRSWSCVSGLTLAGAPAEPNATDLLRRS